jgi:hypothetical protein
VAVRAQLPSVVRACAAVYVIRCTNLVYEAFAKALMLSDVGEGARGREGHSFQPHLVSASGTGVGCDGDHGVGRSGQVRWHHGHASSPWSSSARRSPC